MSDIYAKNNIVSLATGSSSATSALSGSCKKVLVSATQDCYIRIGETTVSTSNGTFIEAGRLYEFPVLYQANVAAIRSLSDGRVTFLELY